MTLDTCWIGAASGAATRRPRYRGTISKVCGDPEGLAAVCRVGPHCMKMMGCRPSRRIGVAVNPSTNFAFARFRIASNENADK